MNKKARIKSVLFQETPEPYQLVGVIKDGKFIYGMVTVVEDEHIIIAPYNSESVEIEIKLSKVRVLVAEDINSGEQYVLTDKEDWNKAISDDILNKSRKVVEYHPTAKLAS